MSGNVLSLLGLALRAGRLVPGDEPSALAAKTSQARLLLAASDASPRTLRRVESLAHEGHCMWLVLPFSKEELGGALGRGGTAVAALTDTGLAAAVTERLAQIDPERYSEAAARMDLKRRRAKERQSAPRRDPPKKDPPPSRGDRRPPQSRRKGGPDGRKPEARQDRPPKEGWGRPQPGAPPAGGRPTGGRLQRAKGPGKGRPFKNRSGPRSGGNRSGSGSSGSRGSAGGRGPNGGGNPTRRGR